MPHSNEFSPIYVRFNGSLSPYPEDSIKQQLIKENPKLANNPHKLRKELLKRVDKKKCVDSSYYLG